MKAKVHIKRSKIIKKLMLSLENGDFAKAEKLLKKLKKIRKKSEINID